MTRRLISLSFAALVVATLPSVAAAQQNVGGDTTKVPEGKRTSDEEKTDARVLELMRQAALRAGVSALDIKERGNVALQQPQAGTPATTQSVGLTLDDAIKLALDRNLDISVQRLNPQTYDFAVSNIESVYRPTLISTVGRSSATNPSTQTISGGSAGTGITQDVNTWNAGMSQNFKWGGGALAVTLNNNKQTTTSTTTLFNPSYNSNWSASYNQPLLRGRAIDVTRQQLTVTKLNQDISEIQLQSLIINTVSNVRNAYWDYVYAVQSVDVARTSVQLAEQLVADNQTRVEIGTMAPIDVVQAQSQAATQRQNLAAAEGTRRTAELALKRIIVNGTQDPNWSVTLDPTDRPDFTPGPIDIPAAVTRAIANRTDLQSAKKSLEINDVTLKALTNLTLPQVDLNARYGLIGQGGTQFVRTGGGISGDISQTIPGGYNDALSTLFNNNYPTWNLTLNISYPLGKSAAAANVARARIQSQQVDAQVKQIELQIATDVTNAATQVMSNVERVQAAQAAREFAQRQLEAEQSKFEVGMSTNYFVVQAQRDLATAQNSELQAVLAYRRSQVELERLQQTSLTTANITILGR